MKIGIVIESIRDGRNGKAVGDWVAEHAPDIADAQVEILDLKEFDIPLLTAATVPAAADRQYESAQVTAWSDAVEACDGFVFVTPEYNHGVPGGFKNAVDSLASQWAQKTVAFVPYGPDGGVRAVEQWRQIVGNLQMLHVRAQVSTSLYADFDADGIAPVERRDTELATLVDHLVTLTQNVST